MYFFNSLVLFHAKIQAFSICVVVQGQTLPLSIVLVALTGHATITEFNDVPNQQHELKNATPLQSYYVLVGY
jgi:hypothetical protein